MGKIILAVAFFALLFFGGYYYLNNIKSGGSGKTDNTPNTGPEETVREFYDWYLAFRGHPLFSGAYKTRGFLSEKYITKLTDLVNQGLKFDPVLCYQEKPYKYAVEEVDTKEREATVKMVLNYYGVLVKNKVELVNMDGKWLISDILCLTQEKSGITEDRLMNVVVYFFNKSKDPLSKKFDVESVYSVARRVDIQKGVYQETIKELFKGPNSAESVQGYTSKLPAQETFDSVKVVDNVAYVNFNSSIKEKFEVTEPSLRDLRDQIEQTFEQFREIEGVYYSIENNPRDFYEWSGIGCPSQETLDQGGFNYCGTDLSIEPESGVIDSGLGEEETLE